MSIAEEDEKGSLAKCWFAAWVSFGTAAVHSTALQLINAAKARTFPDAFMLLSSKENEQVRREYLVLDKKKNDSANYLEPLETLYKTLDKSEFPKLRNFIMCTPGVCSGEPTVGFRLRVAGFLWMFRWKMSDGSDAEDPWLAPLIMAYQSVGIISDEPLRAALLYAYEHPGFDDES